MPIPENRKIPASAQIKGIEGIIDLRVHPAGPQFALRSGLVELDTVYKSSTVTTINFETSGERGARSAPIAHFLDFNKNNAKHLNKQIVRHYGDVVPEALIPHKPISPLGTYNGLSNPSSPKATYTDQAAMTADFAAQTAGSYYYFTGNNGAYKFDGTQTDSINNYDRELFMLGDQSSQVSTEHYYYTGSTSAWQYNGTATGAIGDYTEVVAVAGWENWGTKYDWVIVQGDSYLIGRDNYNLLECTYYDEVKISGTAYYDVVVVNITNYANGNTDANRAKINRLLEFDYNENHNPVLADSISNKSLYGQYFETLVINPENAQYELLSGSNYTLNMNLTGSGSRQVLMPLGFNRFFDNHEITIIWKGEIRNTGSAASRGLFGNRDGSTTGFSFLITNTFQLRMNISDGSTNGSLSSTSNLIVEDGGQYVLAATLRKISPTSNEVKFYRKSAANAIAFELISTHNGSMDFKLNNGLLSDFELDRYGPTGSLRGSKNDHLIVENRILTDAEIQTIANTLDP